MNIEDLYVKYGPLIYRRCLAVLRKDDLAYDALQDVFLILVRKPAVLEKMLSPVSYLYAMATNICLNRLKRDKKIVYDLELCLETETDSEEERGLIRLFLTKLFDKLSHKVRTIVYLRFIDRLTHEEIAEQVSLSVSGVRKNLRSFQQQALKYKERIL